MNTDNSMLSEEQEKKFLNLWKKCYKDEYIPENKTGNSSNLVELFHATNEENGASILASGEFVVPSREYAIENGLKLGAAVYLGSNPQYCRREAENTIGNEGKQIVLLKLEVDLGHCVDLGNYDSGNNLSWRDWEWMTERISNVEAEKFGIDSICINKSKHSFEIALYKPKKQVRTIKAFSDG
jgi:hypothetical protein